MTELSYETVVDTLQALVDENPDHVYNGLLNEHGEKVCQYVHDGSLDSTPAPGCIVGHWLHRQGVPLVSLRQEEGRSAPRVADKFFDISNRSRYLLSELQGFQDFGTPWGRSFTLAKARAEADQ